MVRKRKRKKRPKRSRKRRTKGPASVSASTTSSEEKQASSSAKEWTAGLTLAAVGITVVSILQLGMNGPQFIALYACICVLAAVLVCVAVKAKAALDVSLVVTLLFVEGIGLVRWIYGTSKGMSQFDYMFAWMFFGGFGILLIGVISTLKWEFTGGSATSGGFWGSCSSHSHCGSNCGSSCGSSSGSSCGGGCGGCGGE